MAQKKNKITLLFPKLHFDKRHNPVISVPLAIMSVAAPLIEEGYAVDMINGDIDSDWLGQVVDSCRDALLLGISSMSGPQIYHGLKAAAAVRAAGLSLPIIWGGYHPSILPEETSRHQLVDAVVRGQGEATMLEIAGRLARGEDFTDVAGITFNRDGEIISNPDRKMEDINEFPRLPYEHLASPERYVNNMPLAGARTVNYISSQGCPQRCQFCAEPLVYKRKWKGLKPERVISDMQFLKKFLNVDGISFSDSNFFANRERVLNIADMIAAQKLEIGWCAAARSSHIVNYDDGDFKALKAGGLKGIFVGAESGSNKTLETIQKDITVEETLTAAELATKHGVPIRFFFILGFPGESATDMNDTWKMVEQLSKIIGEHSSVLHFFAPTPGHALFDKSCELGFQRPSSLDEWSHFSTTETSVPWMSRKLINRAKQRDFYYTYSYPTQAILGRAAEKLSYRFYYHIASKLSTSRCRTQYWSTPIDWWMLQGLRRNA